MTQRVFGHLGVSTLLVLGLVSAPVLSAMQAVPAVAQDRRDDRYRLDSGTVIRVNDDDRKTERIILEPDETLDLELVTTRDVRSDEGRLLIPEGSKIEGRFEPSGDGTRFVAERLTLRDGESYEIDALSDVITDTQVVKRGTNTERIWQGAIVGGAASAVLAEILGDIDVLDVLGGAGAGALGGLILGREERREVEVIVVDLDRDLELTLDRDLYLDD